MPTIIERLVVHPSYRAQYNFPVGYCYAIFGTFHYDNLCRVPQHLDGIPILALESNPEFETDPERAKKMMEDVSVINDITK